VAGDKIVAGMGESLRMDGWVPKSGLLSSGNSCGTKQTCKSETGHSKDRGNVPPRTEV